MKKFAITTILACSLAISGCDQLFPQQDDEAEEDGGDAGLGGAGFGDSGSQNGNGGPLVAKDNAQAGNAGQQAPLYSWFIGQWTDDGNCANAITMSNDGSFTNADGSSGTWTLASDQLTMSGNGGSLTVTLQRVDQNRLQLTYPDGQSGFSTRC